MLWWPRCTPIAPGLLVAAIPLPAASSALAVPAPPWHGSLHARVLRSAASSPPSLREGADPVAYCWCWAVGVQGAGLETHVGAGDTPVCPRRMQTQPTPAAHPLPWHPLSTRPSVLLAQSLQHGATEAPGAEPLPSPWLGDSGVQVAALGLGRAWGWAGLSSACCHLPARAGGMLCGAVT